MDAPPLTQPLLLEADDASDHPSPSSSGEDSSPGICVVDVQEYANTTIKQRWWDAWEFDGLDPLPVASPVDPFRNGSYGFGGGWELVKTVLCLPLLVIRVVLIGVFLFLGLLCTKLALLGWKRVSHKAMPRWRQRVMWGTRVCARGILFCFGFHWIRRVGRPAPRDIAPILVSNHVSYIDPIFYFFELFPTIVSSTSHNDILFVGTIIRSMQVILVDRFSTDSRKGAISEIKRRATSGDFPRVLLFPEGTTTNGRALISFKLGAFVPGFPVQPVLVKYPHVHFDISWGNVSLKRLIPRMLLQFHNFMEVHYLPVIYPSLHEQCHPADYAQRVRNAMARSLNVPETEHAYADLLLSAKALTLKMPRSVSFTLETKVMETHLQLSSIDAIYFLEKFAHMNSSRSGLLTKTEFLHSLGLSKSPFGDQAFAVFDRRKHGFITFQEFVAASVCLSRHSDFAKLVDCIFDAAVKDNGLLLVREVAKQLEIACPGSTNKVLVDRLCRQSEQIDESAFRLYVRKNPELIFSMSLAMLS